MEIQMPNTYPLWLCISSVVDKEEGFRDYRFSAMLAARKLGFQVVRNPEDVGMHQSNFESILRDKSPVVLLIVGYENSEMVKKECFMAIENCLPLMIFLKTDYNIISKKTEAFVKEISRMAYDKDCTCFTSAEELYMQVEARLISYLNRKKTAYPIMEAYRGRAYAHSVDMFDGAKKRIILYQQTSSLILGARKGNVIEKRFNEQLEMWLKNKDEKMEFIHIFSLLQTQNAMKEDCYDIEEAKKRLNNMLALPNLQLRNSFVLRYLKKNIDISLFIADCEVLMIFPIDQFKYTITIPPEIVKNTEIAKIAAELNNIGTIVSDIEDLYTQKKRKH